MLFLVYDDTSLVLSIFTKLPKSFSLTQIKVSKELCDICIRMHSQQMQYTKLSQFGYIRFTYNEAYSTEILTEVHRSKHNFSFFILLKLRSSDFDNFSIHSRTPGKR